MFFVLDDHARFAAVCKEWFVLQKSTIVRLRNNIPPMLMIPTQYQLAKRYNFCERKLSMNVQNIEFPCNSLEPFQQQSSAVSRDCITVNCLIAPQMLFCPRIQL